MVLYGCESWTVKKAECPKIDAFELWCWEKTLESSLDCKEIQPVYPKGDQSWVFIRGTEVERYYEDLQDLLELTPKKDVLFIIGD